MTHLLVKMRPRQSLALAIGIALCLVRLVSAQSQEAPISIVAMEARVDFGMPALEGSQGNYLETGVVLFSQNRSVAAAGNGTILFMQSKPLLRGGLPQAAGNFLTLAHRDGFVSQYSGRTFSPSLAGKMNLVKGDLIGSVVGTPGSQKASYMLRVYDGTSGLWVNPAFFIQGLDDRAAPKIMQIALSGQGKTYIADNQKNTAIVIPQGDYTLAIGAFDPSYDSGSVSGVFRLKAVFNGQVVADRKLDSARITERGLAFLELEAPSSSIIDGEGRLLVGKQFVPNGKHTLEIFVYDYVGNVSGFMWKFTAE